MLSLVLVPTYCIPVYVWFVGYMRSTSKRLYNTAHSAGNHWVSDICMLSFIQRK